MPSRSGRATVLTGMPPRVRVGAESAIGPTRMASRYVDIDIEGAKDTRTNPGSAGSRPTSGVLVSARSPSRTVSDTSYVALRSGSSQHGKARRASVAAYCVATTCASSPDGVGYRDT